MVQRHSARLTLGLAVLCVLATGMASARQLAQSIPKTREEAITIATQQCGVAPGSLETVEEKVAANDLLTECGDAVITDDLCGVCYCTFAAGLAVWAGPIMAFNEVSTYEQLPTGCRAALTQAILVASGLPVPRVATLGNTCGWEAANAVPLATVVEACVAR